MIEYKTNGALALDEMIELYELSTLGERRPIHNRQVMRDMMENSDLIATAWDGSKLVGISRTLTDYSYVAYLSDLAVHVDYQKQGIGQELIKRTRGALNPTCMIVLLAAPDANEYYPKIGFESNPRGWALRGEVKA